MAERDAAAARGTRARAAVTRRPGRVVQGEVVEPPEESHPNGAAKVPAEGAGTGGAGDPEAALAREAAPADAPEAPEAAADETPKADRQPEVAEPAEGAEAAEPTEGAEDATPATELLGWSPLGLTRQDAAFTTLHLVSASTPRPLTVSYTMPFGKRRSVTRTATSRILRFQSPSGQPVDLEVRVLSVDEGKRRMLAFAPANALSEGKSCDLSIVPLPAPLSSHHSGHAVLISLPRSRIAETLSVDAYARELGLSRREQQVLAGLCEGLRVKEIAAKLEIGDETVRSHVKRLKAKTGCAGIVDIVNQVSRLPPIVGALRQTPVEQARDDGRS